MSATRWEIRPGVRDDADALAAVHVAAWRAGYAHVFPASWLQGEAFEAGRHEVWNAWRFEPARLLVAVTPGAATGPGSRDAERHESVVGFSLFGAERERAARAATRRGEVWSFYLHPDLWGSGLADELLERTEARLRADGFDAAVLWVLDDNPRARSFYERHGWTATGLRADFDQYCDVAMPELEYRKVWS